MATTYKALASRIGRRLMRAYGAQTKYPTHEALAKRAGVGRTQITNVLGGARLPSLIMLVRLSEALNVSLDELVKP